jgi:hypothetical protein
MSPIYPEPVAPICASIVNIFSAGSAKGLVGLMWLDKIANVGVLIPIVVEPLLTASQALSAFRTVLVRISSVTKTYTTSSTAFCHF